jgi:hypothetical protein
LGGGKVSRIVVRWHNQDQNVVLEEFRTEWDWEELTEAMKSSFELIAKGKKPGALIIDMNHPDAVKNIQAGSYARFQRIRAYVPDNLSNILVVGVSPIMQSLARIFISAVKNTKVKVEFVESLEEADHLLEAFYNRTA